MHWNLFVKLKLLTVLGTTCVLFAAAGYWVTDRLDPLGPFFLGNLSNQMVALIFLAGMLGLTTVAGTLLLHRDLPGVAWMIAAAGWAGLSLRSHPIDNRLIYLHTSASVQGFYIGLLAELGALFAITGIVALLAEWAVKMIPQPTPTDEDAVPLDDSPSNKQRPSRYAKADAPPPDDQDDLLAIVVQIAGTGLLAMLLFLLFVNNQPVSAGAAGEASFLPGPILRGQVLFALAGGFFLAALATHQLFPTRHPWRLAIAPAGSAAICYLLAIFLQSNRMFDYQPPIRVAAALPVDFLGMAMLAELFAFLISLHMVQTRREAAHKTQDDK